MMSNFSVIARPYAKALFEHAVDTQSLEAWLQILEAMACVTLDPAANEFLNHPSATDAQKASILVAPFPADFPEAPVVKRWVELLVAQGRVLAIPTIYEQFLALKREFEQCMAVKVTSFSALTAKQEKALVEKLTRQLKRQVVLEVHEDPSLMGGMMIHAGDWVMDGSVRTQLRTLYTNLVQS